MGHLSLGESSKPQAYHKAHILGELVEVKKLVVHKDEKLSQIAQRLQRLEEAHARENQEEKEEWRLTNFDAWHQPQYCFDFVKLHSISGSNDPCLYLEWEAKVEHLFNVYKVTEDQKVRIASQDFLDCANQ